MEQKKGNIKKILLSIILIISISFLSLFSYGYFYKGMSINEMKDLILNNSNNNTTNSDELNYSFNIEGSYESKKEGKIDNSGSFNLSNGELISKNYGLQQKLSIGKLDLKYGEENESIENLDIIGDNEKVYYFLEKGAEAILTILSVKSKEKIKKTFSEKKYIMIDNSKPIINILGDLAKNDLIKKIALGIATSNPQEYFEQNGINKEIKQYTQSDKFLDYLFTSGEYNETSKKTTLTLNENLCNTYAPILENIFKEIGERNPLFSTIEECKESLTQVNTFLPMLIQLSKKGDIENGNFDLVIAQGNIADISITYKDHIVDTRYINISAPDNMLSLKMNGTKDEILSSLFKVNIDINENHKKITILGEIKDGNGNINILGNIEENKIAGDISFNNYILSNYDIDIKAKYSKNDEGMLTAKGNLKGGTIKFFVNDDGNYNILLFNYNLLLKEYDLKYVAGYSPDYNNWLDRFDWNNFDIIGGYKGVINSSYNNKKFVLNGYETDRKGEKKDEYDIVYDNGIIKGNIKIEGSDIEMKGNINGQNDYSIELEEKNMQVNFTLKGSEKSETETEHSVNYEMKGNNIFSVLLNINDTKKNGFEILNSKLDLKIPDGDIDVISNLKLSFKKGKLQYKIPENFNEIDISLAEISPLPNFYEFSKIDKTFLLGTTSILGGLGTISFISLEGYAADARNSKRTSDLGSIISKMTIEITKGVPLENFIIIDKTYAGKNIYVGGTKLALGENYFVGTPNYRALNMNKSDFIDPDGSEYLFGVTTENYGKYQVFSKTETGDNKYINIVKGNYIKGENKSISIEKSGNNNFTLKSPIDVNKILIGNSTNLGKIKKISSNGMIYTLDKEVKEGTTEIQFLKDNSDGLIFINGKAIKDGDKYNETISNNIKKEPIEIPKEQLNVIGKLPLLISAFPKTMPSKQLIGVSVVGGGAVFGTIAYISLQGYSADARNSKRTSDVGSIIRKITIEITKGVALQSFVTIDKNYAGKNMYVGGTKLILGENYFVGTPNYRALNMKESEFLDPDGNEYLIGVTFENGLKYQVGAFYETSNGKEFVVKGNYSGNKFKSTKITITGKKTVKIPNSMTNYYRVGNNTNLGKIVKVSDNGVDLTFDKEIDKKAKAIYIKKIDTKSLILVR